jgi:hypothetical protein
MPGVGPSYVVSINFDHVSMGGSDEPLEPRKRWNHWNHWTFFS